MRKVHQLALIVAAALSSAAASQTLTQSCDSPSFLSKSTAINSACDAAGQGGKEAVKSKVKNNFCAQDSPAPYAFDKLKLLQVRVDNDQNIPFARIRTATRQPGPATNRHRLTGVGEGELVVLNAFVLKVRNESDECNDIVAEMSPCHPPPEWPAHNLKQSGSGAYANP